jgi:hypothetical protein
MNYYHVNNTLTDIISITDHQYNFNTYQGTLLYLIKKYIDILINYFDK